MSLPPIPAGPLELELPTVPTSVGKARHAVAEFCAGRELDREGVAIAVSEAVSNAVLHAHPDGAEGHVRIFASLDDASLLIVVSDDGQGITPRSDRPGMGVGLALIAQLTSSLEIDCDGTGTRLAMRFVRRA
ncbi:MAG: ATP-binding protein [Solirubrobacteraceae bacterium]